MLNKLLNKKKLSLLKKGYNKFTILPEDRPSLLKICQMLNTDYKDNNDEIPIGTKIRLIDGDTNQFYGIYNLDIAM